MKRTSRQPSTLSHSLQRQLSMYALAATAAGVGMLAFVQPAEAKVVYTPAHRWLPLNQFYDLDLNHDGVNDFQFFLRFSSWFSGFYGTLAVHPQLGNAVFGKLDGSQTLSCALPKGRKVGPKSPFFP